MDAALFGAFAGLVGVGLGGGLQALQARLARKAEGEAVLSALVPEVEAVARLANHRQFLAGVMELRDRAQAMVASGSGEQHAPWMQVKLTNDYFTTYHASAGKIGLLHPYYADRIVRFYTIAKACLENYHPDSPHQVGVPAVIAVTVLENDAQLLQTMTMLGGLIAGFRHVKPPKGITDPFLNQPMVVGPPSFMPIDAPAEGISQPQPSLEK